MAGTLHTQAHRDLIKSLIEARKAKGLSQAQLAAILGKPPSYVAKVELCERRLDVLEFCAWAKELCDEPFDLLRPFVA